MSYNRRRFRLKLNLGFIIVGVFGMVFQALTTYEDSIMKVGIILFSISLVIATFLNFNFSRIISSLTGISLNRVKSNKLYLVNNDYIFSSYILTISIILGFCIICIYAYYIITKDIISVIYDISINIISITLSLILIEIFYNKFINKAKKDITHGKTSLFNNKQRRLRSKRYL